MIELFLGGSRSGKSKLAEESAAASHLAVTYVATCQPYAGSDAQMQARITQHQARRPAHWALIEEATDLASVINNTGKDTCLLIDCLTLWLSNCLFWEDDSSRDASSVTSNALNHTYYYQQKQALLKALENSAGHIIFVSNETNMGVVPMGEVSRVFCDEVGLLHQDIASASDKVTFVVAGLAQVLKDKHCANTTDKADQV